MSPVLPMPESMGSPASFPIAAIVGLGNPGAEYDRTRHNIGFMAIDHLAAAWRIKLAAEKRFQGIYGEGSISRIKSFESPELKMRLLKPTTFMNLSGQSVRSLANWYKIAPQSILVIYDDLDLTLGKVRLRLSGSAGGHNGMKSIIDQLGTQNFPRLRIGIGRGSDHIERQDTVRYVLGNFLATETKVLPDLFQLVLDLITSIGTGGIERTMSLYNSRSIPVSRNGADLSL